MKQALAGILFCTIGIAVSVTGLRYGVGTSSVIGPGFYPVAIGVVLGLLGLYNCVAGYGDLVAYCRQLKHQGFNSHTLIYAILRILLIGLSLTAFVVLGIYSGMIAAVFSVVFISSFADRNNNWKVALLLASGTVAACVVIFYYGIHMRFPLY